MEKKRSIGIKVVGILAITLPIIAFYIAIRPLSIPAEGKALVTSWYPLGLRRFYANQSVWTLVRLYFRISTLGVILSGIGILFFKNWARVLYILTTTVIFVITFSVFLLHMMRKIVGTIDFTIFIPLYFIITIFYLTRFKVKEQFK